MSDALAVALSRAIRAERSRLGLSQEALAVKLGMDRSTISQIERLARRVYADELPEICEALGVTLDQLLARADRPDRARLGL